MGKHDRRHSMKTKRRERQRKLKARVKRRKGSAAAARSIRKPVASDR